MKRYLLFMASDYYPQGGISDLKLAFNSMEELDDFIMSWEYSESMDFFNMYDCLENRSLYDEYTDNDENRLCGDKKEDYSIIIRAFLRLR